MRTNQNLGEAQDNKFYPRVRLREAKVKLGRAYGMDGEESHAGIEGRR